MVEFKLVGTRNPTSAKKLDTNETEQLMEELEARPELITYMKILVVLFAANTILNNRLTRQWANW